MYLHVEINIQLIKAIHKSKLKLIFTSYVLDIRQYP